METQKKLTSSTVWKVYFQNISRARGILFITLRTSNSFHVLEAGVKKPKKHTILKVYKFTSFIVPFVLSCICYFFVIDVAKNVS